MECNPDSVDAAKLARLRGRGREPRVVRRAVDACPRARRARPHPRPGQRRARPSAGPATPGSSVSTSTSSTGRPRSGVADWEATLDAALALEPTHVSAYALTVEPGTPLGQAVAAGQRAAPDDDDQATKYELADEPPRRRRASQWYEISNWALPGRGVPPQPPLLVGRRVRRHRLRRARPRRDPVPGVVAAELERPHARALRRGGRRRHGSRGGRRGARRRPRPRRSGSCSRSAPGRGSSSTPRTPTYQGCTPCIDVAPGPRTRRAARRRSRRSPAAAGSWRNEVAARLLGALDDAGRGRRPPAHPDRRRRRRLALGRIECQWTSTSARPRSSGPSWRSTSRPRSRSDRRPSRARVASACPAPPCATR